MPITRTWSIVGTRQLVEAEGEYGPDIAGDIATHTADSTSVHGITDTAALPTSPDIDIIDVVTQAAYDGLTPVATTLYVIVG